MKDFSEQIWQRFRKSLVGRMFAAALIAAPIGGFAAAEVNPAFGAVTLSTLSAAAIGVMAVGALELRDRRRNQTGEWKCRVTRATEEVRRRYPLVSAEHAAEIGQEAEEQRLTPVVWVGIALGGFSLLCGIAMAITRVIEFLREL